MSGNQFRTADTPTNDVGTELLFENEIVRVWAMELAPGEASPVHRHFCDYVIAYAEPLDAEIRLDGQTTRAHYEAGYVAHFPVPIEGSGVQQLANVGREVHRHFVIELLGYNEQAPQASNARARQA